MANVAHASMTGSELHEPKGADAAALGTVYVANGAGSGSWASIGTSNFTGMIADFPAPVVPTGWLECDGSVISTATYSALYAVLAMTSSGTRTNGSPVITSIPSTTNMKAGYYVFGNGFASGLTIVSVDSPTQITLSGNASSGGTSAIAISPFLLGTGTITLPDLTTAGRYRRSRTSSTIVGTLQADGNKSHSHLMSGAPSAGTLATAAGGAHIHTITDPGHVHGYTKASASALTGAANFTGADSLSADNTSSSTTGISINTAADHTHTITGAPGIGTLVTQSDVGGLSEARPVSMVMLTCIKT